MSFTGRGQPDMKQIIGTLGRIVLGAMLFISGTSHASVSNCRPPCQNVEAGIKPTSIIPGPDFNAVTSRLALLLSGDRSQQVALGFNFQIGAQTYSSVFINENGLLSFGRAISQQNQFAVAAPTNGFQSVANLDEFGIPVIAPFYADLRSSADAQQDFIGNIVVESGRAVPYADGRRYSDADFQSALRISWYGLAGPDGSSVFAQVVLSGNSQGTSSFDFRYGPPGRPGQAGLGSIAGFSLGADSLQFGGPYTDGTPTYFEFNDGRLVRPDAVPEPETWIELLLGFAVMGAVLRQRSRRTAATPLPA